MSPCWLLLIGALIGTTALLGARIQYTPGVAHKGSYTVTEPHATTTSLSTVIFSDPLSQNIHSWPVGNLEGQTDFFKDDAYHITNQSSLAAVVLNQQNFPQTTLSYQITMEKITDDAASAINMFGLLLRYNKQTIKGVQVITFYVFGILNQTGKSQYVLYKYDSSHASPWTPLGQTINAGKEFHSGHGPGAINTVKISVVNNAFTFSVNSQSVGTATDTSPLKPGKIGMLVVLKGTEVAFSNLLLAKI
ncbi:MAG TPA: hypothetical protein VGD98_11680 [Ktedonobacteraceae bacterium]